MRPGLRCYDDDLHEDATVNGLEKGDGELVWDVCVVVEDDEDCAVQRRLPSCDIGWERSGGGGRLGSSSRGLLRKLSTAQYSILSEAENNATITRSALRAVNLGRVKRIWQ